MLPKSGSDTGWGQGKTEVPREDVRQGGTEIIWLPNPSLGVQQEGKVEGVELWRAGGGSASAAGAGSSRLWEKERWPLEQ